MKYTLEIYGLSFHMKTNNINNDLSQELQKRLNNDNDLDYSLIEEEFELYDKVLEMEKLYYLNDTIFKLFDEKHQLIYDFTLDKLKDAWDVFDPEEPPQIFNDCIDAKFSDNYENTLLSIDEYKGGYAKYSIDSKSEPTINDFCVTLGIVEADLDYEFIDKVYFKKSHLEEIDYLDSRGKNSYLKILTSNGDAIDLF
jgi:hypothetical protein